MHISRAAWIYRSNLFERLILLAAVLFQIEISKTYSRAEWGEDIKKVGSEGGSAG